MIATAIYRGRTPEDRSGLPFPPRALGNRPCARQDVRQNRIED
jgi:hypothetical protein